MCRRGSMLNQEIDANAEHLTPNVGLRMEEHAGAFIRRSEFGVKCSAFAFRLPRYAPPFERLP
jgi:hypothetical protein